MTTEKILETIGSIKEQDIRDAKENRKTGMKLVTRYKNIYG